MIMVMSRNGLPSYQEFGFDSVLNQLSGGPDIQLIHDPALVKRHGSRPNFPDAGYPFHGFSPAQQVPPLSRPGRKGLRVSLNSGILDKGFLHAAPDLGCYVGFSL